jgi:methionyl-tRNA formyltransferase
MGFAVMKKEFVLLSEKPWHDELFINLSGNREANWIRIRSREDFTAEKLKQIKPVRIYIPHWSYIIPAEIYNAYECIVFHMTDLPYGRGGSPLQNLIVNGHHTTMISAIRVEEGIDTGPVYLKKTLSLEGSAGEIFKRSASIIGEMILEIEQKQLKPMQQIGEPVVFKRRKPEEGNLTLAKDLNQAYDFIRMLDCEGYPPAFLEIGDYRLEFTNASLQNENKITAHVSITKK